MPEPLRKPLKKPLVGIVCGRFLTDQTPYYGTPAAYTKAVALAGGLPVLIAPNVGEEALRDIYERLDGVLLAGGGDVDPSCYAMSEDSLVHGVDPVRDAAEINLVRWSVADDVPLFGICRGCQVANVALGGTLYRDIKTEYLSNNGLDHDLWGKVPRDYLAHNIRVQPGTRLSTILGDSATHINSLHHQAIRDIASGLIVSARADDGTVEGVELPDAHFFVAVQWHPEELVSQSEPMLRLFEAFVHAAQAQF